MNANFEKDFLIQLLGNVPEVLTIFDEKYKLLQLCWLGI